jgi:hypothetical protein
VLVLIIPIFFITSIIAFNNISPGSNVQSPTTSPTTTQGQGGFNPTNSPTPRPIVTSPPTQTTSHSTWTMKNLQDDYNAWTGNFKSFNAWKDNFQSFPEGDTFVFRDTITSISRKQAGLLNVTHTTLYFSAYVIPTTADLKAGNVKQNSWYSWYTYPGGELDLTNGCGSIFVNKLDTSTGTKDYLPEVGIYLGIDDTKEYRVGDTVELTLHVWIMSFSWNPNIGYTETEGIQELKI